MTFWRTNLVSLLWALLLIVYLSVKASSKLPRCFSRNFLSS